VASFGDWDEAMGLANGHGYGLSAAVYTENSRTAFRFREAVSSGMVSINNSTSGAEAHPPFGGNGKSGNGSRQSGDAQSPALRGSGFRALDRVAHQPEHGRPQADEQGPALGVTALVLVNRLGADP